MGKCLVLSSKEYNFTDSNGKQISGVKIAYINKRPSTRENEYGHSPLITTCPISLIKGKGLEKLPAIYDLEFEQVTGAKNKPELLLVDLELVSSVDISILFD